MAARRRLAGGARAGAPAGAGAGGPVRATVSPAPHTYELADRSPFAAANGTGCAASCSAPNKQRREETQRAVLWCKLVLIRSGRVIDLTELVIRTNRRIECSVHWLLNMPKIFLIKKRLHEQQLGLQEGQELLSKGDPLCPGSPLDDGPIPLLSKRDKECVGEFQSKAIIYNGLIHRSRHLSVNTPAVIRLIKTSLIYQIILI